MMKPSVRYLLPAMGLGGAERHVIALASGLRKRGYDAGVVCLFEEGVLAEEVRQKEIPFACLDLPRRWGAGTMRGVYRWLRENPADILHTYLFGFHFYAGLPARMLRTSVILSTRREIALWRKGRHVWAENLGNLFTDGVICCSDAVEQWTLETEKVRRAKVFTIRNGVDLDRFAAPGGGEAIRRGLGIPSEAPVVGTVANFSPDKGYPHLLDAARRVLEEIPAAYFLFVGSGPLLEDMKKAAQAMPGSGRLIFAGARDDVPALLDAMDVFTLASVTEGFPNVVLEAMAAGKPIAATRVGGIPELIASGEDGVLVPPADGPALAQALLGLLRDPSEAADLGARAREKVRKDFSMQGMMDRYENLYLGMWKNGK